MDDIIMPFGKYKYDNIELRGDLQQAVSQAIDDHQVMESRRGRVVK